MSNEVVEPRVTPSRRYRTQLVKSEAAESVAIEVPRGITFTRTALTIRSRLSVAEWEQLVEGLIYLRTGTPWWIGDAIAFGESAYGRRYTRAAKTTGLAPGTLRNYASVSRRISPEVRDPALSWRSHYLVAGLNADNQRRWLDRAAKWGWSSAELAAQMRNAKLTKSPPDEFPKPSIETEYECPSCHFRFSGAPYQRERRA